MRHPDALVQVFCKSPVLGEVKTRLSPALDTQEVLSLYEGMLALTIPRMTSQDICPAQLWITRSGQTGSRQTGSRQTGSRQTGSRQTGSRQTGSRQTGSRQTGSRQEAFFDQFPLERHFQQGNDLGECMSGALEEGLKDFDRVVLVGGDVPDIDADYIESAIDALDTHEVVLGPAEDGGYGLIGVRQQVPDVFSGVDWGTDQVLSQTCCHLNAQAINYALLPYLWDVDRPDDLSRYHDWLRSLN